MHLTMKRKKMFKKKKENENTIFTNVLWTLYKYGISTDFLNKCLVTFHKK